MFKKNIFVIHNHKNFSGAARSLGELMINLKKKVEFIVICPKGSSSRFFKSLNLKVIEVRMVPRFNHFELGYYKGLRWLLIVREIIAFIYFLFFLKNLKKKFNSINFFHLNELELVIIAPLLSFFFKAQITSHLRCPLELKNGKLRFKFLKKLCKKYLRCIVAIDNDCYKTSPIKRLSKIIYNGINKKNLLIADKKKSQITFGFVGNFIERKGIYLTLKVFKKLEKKYNLKLICVGRSKTRNWLLNFFRFEKDFEKFVKVFSIEKCKNIKMLPLTFNLKDFYSKVDIILFPGFMNAVGRPVIEASLLRKPSIIALDNYNNDTAKKNNCLIFAPGDIISFEKKILYFIKNRSKVKKMGESAYINAKKNFDINKNSKKFYKVIWS